MSDLIDRQALLKQIDIDSDGEPGYYGDTWKFIDTIKNMPNVHDLPKDTDTISRKAVTDALEKCHKHCCREDASGDEWIHYDTTLNEVESIPPAKVATDINVGDKDTISRNAAIEEIERWIGYIDDDMVRRMQIGMKRLPPAQPNIIRCRNCKFASGDSRICMQFGHSPIGELDFCAWAERRTDE